MNESTSYMPKTLGVAQITPINMGGTQESFLDAGNTHSLSVVDQGSHQLATGIVLPTNFPLPLNSEQLASIQARVSEFSFHTIATRDIPKLGLSAEMELGRALDAFLSRINQQGSPALFKLTDELTNRFEEAKLEEVADRILNAKPGFFARLYGMLNKKFLRNAVAKIYEEVSRMASGRSKTLADHVNAIQRKLEAEMRSLSEELTHMDRIKEAYRANLLSFAIETAFLHNALIKARVQFADAEPELRKDQQAYQDAMDKLQALESRALAVEGGMTRLPADQIVIRQLQNAGVSTLQELSTTMAARFNSIKSELLTIHGALAVQAVQRLGEQGAALDANLGKVRGKLMNQVTTTAANMPGNNRIQQAEQLKALVNQSRELQRITDAARTENKKKFEQARDTMSNVRKDLLEIGLAVNPGQSVSGSF